MSAPKSFFWGLSRHPEFMVHTQGHSVSATLTRMADDIEPEPIPFPVEVTVNGVKVRVTLMLKPGTTVSVAEKEPTRN
jgi:hypothetical protein